MDRFYCGAIGPSVNGVLCKNMENSDDIVHCPLDFRPYFLEVSGVRFCVIVWLLLWL